MTSAAPINAMRPALWHASVACPIVAAIVQLSVWIARFHRISETDSWVGSNLLIGALGLCLAGLFLAAASQYGKFQMAWYWWVPFVLNPFVFFQGMLVVLWCYLMLAFP